MILMINIIIIIFGFYYTSKKYKKINVKIKLKELYDLRLKKIMINKKK